MNILLMAIHIIIFQLKPGLFTFTWADIYPGDHTKMAEGENQKASRDWFGVQLEVSLSPSFSFYFLYTEVRIIEFT